MATKTLIAEMQPVAQVHHWAAALEGRCEEMRRACSCPNTEHLVALLDDMDAQVRALRFAVTTLAAAQVPPAVVVRPDTRLDPWTCGECNAPDGLHTAGCSRLES